MSVQNKLPAIRFEIFSNEWESRKFEQNLISVQTGTNLLGALINTGRPLIKMGNIQRGFFSFNKIERLEKSVEAEKENIANYGDFLFNTRNTLELVGKGATWMGNSNEFAFNNNIARFSFHGVNTIFFNYLYNTQRMIKQVQARAMGTTSVAAIYPQSLKSITYSLPNIDEQTKIGNYFQQLDTLIAQHQQKHDKLLNLKKALLEKMFPEQGKTESEIQFIGFSVEWEQKALGILAHVVDPHPSHRAPNAVSQGVPFIGIGDISEDGKVDFSNVRIVSARIYDEHSKRYAINEGDFAYGRVASIGKIIDLSKNALSKYTYSPTMALVKPISVNPAYLKSYLNTEVFKDCVDNKTTGSTRKSLGVEAFRNLPVFYPNNNEQQKKIGDLFKQFDTLIAQHKTQIKKLGHIKQACLDKMFV